MKNVSNIQYHEKYVICKQYVYKGRQVRVVSLARGAMDDDYDDNDRIYAV